GRAAFNDPGRELLPRVAGIAVSARTSRRSGDYRVARNEAVPSAALEERSQDGPFADRPGEGVGGRPREDPREGKGAHARPRRARGRAPTPALGADREGLRLPGPGRESAARRPLRRAPPAPALPLHVRTQPDGGLRGLLDGRRPGGASRAPARA